VIDTGKVGERRERSQGGGEQSGRAGGRKRIFLLFYGLKSLHPKKRQKEHRNGMKEREGARE
jgi:hypothetical protein